MSRGPSLLGLVLVLVVASCGGNKDDAPKTKDRGAQGEASEVAGPGSAEEAPPGRVEKILSARGIPAAEAEGGEVKPIDITINLEENQRASGVFRLAGGALDLYGFQQDGRLRLWIGGKAGDGDPRRGYLIGTIDGQTATGSFALSGNGGEPSLQGTWASVEGGH
jgi:hypothetical protein